MIPKQYDWLLKEPGPKVLKEALKLYGVIETPGPGNNPTIIGWGKEIGQAAGMAYTEDAVPWCGLFMGVVVHRAGYAPPPICVRASSWDSWGNSVAIKNAALGDVVRLQREGGGHVAVCIGWDKQGRIYLLGGNQGDAVNIKPFLPDRIKAVRRCPWKNAQPANVRRVLLAASGQLSDNEA